MGLSSGLGAFRVGWDYMGPLRRFLPHLVTWVLSVMRSDVPGGEFVSFGGKAGPNGLVCASVDVVMERVCLLSFWPEQDHSPIFRILPRVNCPAIFRLQ